MLFVCVVSSNVVLLVVGDVASSSLESQSPRKKSPGRGFGLKIGWPCSPARCPKPCQSLTFMDSSPEMRKAMPPHNPSLA
eukprot:16118530-Heterocapsa_arctica.AAC.1